jgi:hypothetical protein
VEVQCLDTQDTMVYDSAAKKVHLVEVSAEQRSQDSGGLHGQDDVPVYEGPVEVGVAPAHVEYEVGDGPAHNRDVGQRHGRVGGKSCAQACLTSASAPTSQPTDKRAAVLWQNQEDCSLNQAAGHALPPGSATAR